LKGEREKRKSIAEDTLEILKKGYFISPNGDKIDIKRTQDFAESNTMVYTPEASDKLIESKVETKFPKPADIIVNELSTLEATREMIDTGYKNVVCLNFASAKNPGGGFLGGSQAQEESIARSTGLYNCLLNGSEYYQANKKYGSCFYTDYMIYAPKVPIIKDDAGNNLEELYTTGIITAPAVNTGVVSKQEKKNLGKVEGVMKRRIKKVLAIAANNGHAAIILGAWGCGVFRNDPNDIARYFHEVIEEDYRYSFKKIVFAVYSRNERFINPFYKLFYGGV